ncbi:MAG: acyl carrier protein [Rhizobiaceae bacterium]
MLAKNDAADQVAKTVFDTITDLLEEQGLESNGFDEQAKLVDTLGLKSMDIAQVVLMLEDELDADPFQEIPITSIRTVGDLINAYRVTLDPSLAADLNAAASDDASASQPVATGTSRRANRRR